jgi:hypothetical protein
MIHAICNLISERSKFRQSMVRVCVRMVIIIINCNRTDVCTKTIKIGLGLATLEEMVLVSFEMEKLRNEGVEINFCCCYWSTERKEVRKCCVQCRRKFRIILTGVD